MVLDQYETKSEFMCVTLAAHKPLTRAHAVLQDDDGEVERFTETFVRSFLLGLGAGAILETLHVTSKVLQPRRLLLHLSDYSVLLSYSGGAPWLTCKFASPRR